MEDVENTNKVVKNGFINHVFNFDNDTKTEVLNVGQYLLLAIIPMGFYNYMVDSVIPEVDESKSNLEIKLYIETRPEGINEKSIDLLKKLKVDGVGMGVELADEKFRM